MEIDTYELFAIKYARLSRRSPDNFVGGDAHDVEMPLNYYVWVARSASRTFVIDTGFGAEVGARRGREILHPVAAGLQALGVDPETVQDVIVTHMHYDHAGNLGLFPRARYHLHGRCARQPCAHRDAAIGLRMGAQHRKRVAVPALADGLDLCAVQHADESQPLA